MRWSWMPGRTLLMLTVVTLGVAATAYFVVDAVTPNPFQYNLRIQEIPAEEAPERPTALDSADLDRLPGRVSEGISEALRDGSAMVQPMSAEERTRTFEVLEGLARDQGSSPTVLLYEGRVLLLEHGDNARM